jgi:hypothetical protein
MAATPLILALLLAAPLAAQPTGTWKLTGGDDIPAVLEKGTASVSFLIRGIARSRLKKTNSAYQRIQIQRPAGEVTIQYDDRQPQHMPADGRAVKWTREDGEAFQISARTERGELVQHYQGEDGERTNVFHFEGGALTLTVTVKSPKLPQPITYKLTYKAD